VDVSVWAELRRRNVFRVGGLYLATAWIFSQVGDVVAQTFDAPAWPMRMLLVLLALGFPVAVVLAWLFELTPDGLKLTRDVPEGVSLRRETGRRLDYALIGMIGLLVVVLIADNWLLPGRTPTAVVAAIPSPAPAVAAGGVLPNSVAVLPLENLSPDPNNAYVAAGLHEEILNQLAKLRSLNVISRSSVLGYAENRPPIAEIARALNVQSIMEGSIRYAGGRIRVTTQLIDSGTGAHLWSETYDREFDDIFAIESDIAMNVANALAVEFSLEEQAAIEALPTSSPEAYALYLQALDVWRSNLSGAGALAHDLLDRAIALDPSFARAYAVKAQAYNAALINTVQGTAVAPEGRQALERLAREHAERALLLDPAEAVARIALRGSNVIAWRWTDYVDTLSPAEERELSGPTVWVVSWLGRHTNAVRIARANATLNPGDDLTHQDLGIVLAYAGDRAASTASFEQALTLSPLNPLPRAWIAYNRVATGDASGALQDLQLLERALGPNPAIVFLPELAYAYSRVGRTEDAQRLFAAIESRAATTDVGAGTWAMGHLAIGNEAEALRQLEIAAEKARNHEPDQGYIMLMNLRMNFLADPRLDEPPFATILSLIRGD
jgi:TolB-like protein